MNKRKAHKMATAVRMKSLVSIISSSGVLTNGELATLSERTNEIKATLKLTGETEGDIDDNLLAELDRIELRIESSLCLQKDAERMKKRSHLRLIIGGK